MTSGWIGILIGVFVVAFVLVNMLPLLRARRIEGHAAPDLGAILDQRQRGQELLLVYFWSPSCGMCRSITPFIDRLARERPDVVKVNIAEHLELARAFGILATPSFARVRGGVVEKLAIGAKTEPQIRALLES